MDIITSAEKASALVKRMSRTSLECVVFEVHAPATDSRDPNTQRVRAAQALLAEAADGKSPTLERVMRILGKQEEETNPQRPAPPAAPTPQLPLGKDKATWEELTEQEQAAARAIGYNPVSYTHLTLPTILLV